MILVHIVFLWTIPLENFSLGIGMGNLCVGGGIIQIRVAGLKIPVMIV